jgi:hypothetical protein
MTTDFFLKVFVSVRRGKDAYAAGAGSPPDNSARAPPLRQQETFNALTKGRLASIGAFDRPARRIVFPWSPLFSRLDAQDDGLDARSGGWVRFCFNCAQFCAHHQTLLSVTECRDIGRNPCWTRHL